MLLRTARHAVPPPITLDFLIPNSVLRSGPCRPSLIRAGSSLRKNDWHRVPLTPRPTNVTPGTILTRLEEELDVSESQPLASFTNSQAATFNEAFSELRTAFANRDIAAIDQAWSSLKSQKLLSFFGPSQYGICSRRVREFCTHRAPEFRFSSKEISLLEDIALFAAAGGATDALRSLMVFSIQKAYLGHTITLYKAYLERLREKGLLREVVEVQSDAEGDLDEVTSTGIPAPISPIRDELLVCAVCAHAQRDSFFEALPMFLEARTRVSQTVIQQFLRRITFNPMLKSKTREYMHRLDTAALLARPEALMKHLTNLTRDSATRSLERLYTQTIAGAQGSDPWLAVRPEDLAGTRVVLLPNFFWASFIKSFLACQQADMVERLWDDMLALGVVPDVVCWNTLLDGHANHRAIDAVLSTWDIMASQNVQPDALSYRAVIRALFLVGRYEQAMNRLDEFEKAIPQLGLPLHDSGIMAVYNITLFHLLFAGQEDRADAILEKMETQGPKPDIVTYNTFLRHHARKGDLKAMAQILQKLEPSGVKADIYTFSTLLSSMLKVRPDADRMMINFMKRQGVAPDTTALTAVIDNQLREATPHGLKTAMELLGRMERNEYENAEPNAITYTSVLTALNSGKWADRQIADEYSGKIWDTMRRRGIQPTRTAYNTLLRASLVNPEPEGLTNAMRYYHDMLEDRVHMGNDTWYILLRGLLDRGELGLAQEIVGVMRKLRTRTLPESLQKLVNVINRRAEGNANTRAYF